MQYSAKFVKNGNIKLGHSMWSFSKLAGSGEISGCKGTCGAHCTGCYDDIHPRYSPCYAIKSYRTYGWENGTVVRSHIRNTDAIRRNIDQAFADINLQIKNARNKPTAIRIHAAGEIETAQELNKWIDTASRNPEIPFYIYTKAYEIVSQVLHQRAQIPRNFTILISVWHDEGLDAYRQLSRHPAIKAFVYDDGGFDYKDKIKKDCVCPAYKKDERGRTHLDHEKTCDKCGLCYNDRVKCIFCASH